jgi:hypothetical protein
VPKRSSQYRETGLPSFYFFHLGLETLSEYPWLNGFSWQGLRFGKQRWCFSKCVGKGLEWRELELLWADSSSLLPGSRISLGTQASWQGAKKSWPRAFPNSQPPRIGTCHRERGRHFTKQARHVPYSCVLRNFHTDPCWRPFCLCCGSPKMSSLLQGT